MAEIDYYEIVRQKLAVGPLQAPKHEKIFELMKIFWDEETIRVLSFFPNAQIPISPDEVAEKSGIPKQEVKKILKAANKKRTIAKIGNKFALEPILPGVFEAYFIVRQDSEENLKAAAQIYRYLFEHANEISVRRQEFQNFSPILPLESTEKLIKIDESVDATTQVLPFELVEEMINKNEKFAVIPCQCRLISELNGDPCTVAPASMGCFSVGLMAEAVVGLGMGRALTKEEAIEFIKETEKAGLVHNAFNESQEHGVICNCCSCHCGSLFPMKQFQFKRVRPSNFAPQPNPELCGQCKTCLKKCPMEAISYQEGDQTMTFDYEKCIGCGICAANCKKNAILMERVHNVIPAEKNKIGNRTFGEMLNDLLS